MVQEKRRGKRSPRELVRREPPDDPAEAVERLIDLIQEHGKWIDAPVGEPVEI